MTGAPFAGEARRPRRRGRPLAVLTGLLAVWVAGRAAVWESPLAVPGAPPSAVLAERGATGAALVSADIASPERTPQPAAAGPTAPPPTALAARAGKARARSIFGRDARGGGAPSDAAPAAAHRELFAAPVRAGSTGNPPPFAPPSAVPGRADEPAAAHLTEARPVRADRWSLDAWAFWREGSDAAPISQGRVPIYGASQLGANLQWRARPSSPHDPRAYARAYRALVRRGESELALGVSARPLPRLPVRAAGEVRVTDGPFATELRPAAFAVTEFAPLRLPFDLTLEAYAQGGYVGGEAATAFADGQAVLAAEVAAFDSALFGRSRLSLGAGAWGGAQEGASRVDVGPTMQLDVRVGEVPARLSVGWRERVGGDAAPASGVAATLSTRF
ncbi:hypothetical protein [Erythrobacter sp. HL-111]|uniref:hypothetical protein n=1 Tax=Erythrobacter sp. HL-111 TaxID=1798193 RepID=UPI0006DBA131|nr:hypothetical protein [Erythrobacter sp. HL-111]KPP84951.1 MAG: Urocanase [Erythrobacteraceae bacterium HL-111]SDT08661.1 hypothetical protein SAMN04515621_2878 [Erythrobacter sp. HL-111]